MRPMKQFVVPQSPSKAFQSARSVPPRRVGSAVTQTLAQPLVTLPAHGLRPSWRFSFSGTRAIVQALLRQLLG